MGIRGILHILRRMTNFLWKLVMVLEPNTNGSNDMCGVNHWTEFSASTEDSSSTTSSRVTPEILPRLRLYARSQLTVGRKIAEGGQAVIHEAHMASTSNIRPVSVVVKKFKEYRGVIQGLFPPQFDTYTNMYVCKPTGFFFDDDGSLCMIMDRYSGDLRDLIDSRMKLRDHSGPPFTESVAVSIIIQLALALKSLHGSKIYHRDLKCKNILVQKNPKEILVPSGALDMQFAIAISDFETSKGVVGTGFWRGPEILQRLKDDEWHKGFGIQWDKADVYAFGMTCYEILAGNSPFQGDKFGLTQDIVLSGGRPELPVHVPQGLKEIIQKCWCHDPSDRPTFDEIIPLLKQIDQYRELWAVGFSEVESLMCWESCLETPDAVLLELERLVVMDTTVHKLEGHRRTASKFVVTAKDFVSRYGWDSFVTNPSKPFAEFVERERLYTLMTSQYSEDCDIYNEFVHHKDESFDRKTRIVWLMEKVYFTATDEAWQSKYSEQAHDEEFTLSEKLSTVERAFMKPLCDARANKLLVFKVAKRLLQEELSKEDHLNDIEIFQLKFMISTSLLLVPECLRCLVGLQDVVSSSKVEILTEKIFSFPSLCILLHRVFTKDDDTLSHFLKVFLDQLAIDLFLPVVTLFLQLKLLGWRGLLSWWLLAGILKGLCILTWRSIGQTLTSSKSISHRTCYLVIHSFLEMQWIHYLALTVR
ncbi:hypothetical protein M758_11G034200 [Ceratodon purpureus]|nr:hypothetical protein M758_11G034200 [Ceratodon purpureus]